MRLMAKWALFKVLKEFGLGGEGRKERRKERKERSLYQICMFACF